MSKAEELRKQAAALERQAVAEENKEYVGSDEFWEAWQNFLEHCCGGITRETDGKPFKQQFEIMRDKVIQQGRRYTEELWRK